MIQFIDNYVTVGGVRHYTTVGEAPSEEDVKLLVRWLQEHVTEDVFFIDSLPEMYAEAEKYKHVAGSGPEVVTLNKIGLTLSVAVVPIAVFLADGQAAARYVSSRNRGLDSVSY